MTFKYSIASLNTIEIDGVPGAGVPYLYSSSLDEPHGQRITVCDFIV
jgi:hypothetical protein